MKLFAIATLAALTTAIIVNQFPATDDNMLAQAEYIEVRSGLYHHPTYHHGHVISHSHLPINVGNLQYYKRDFGKFMHKWSYHH